jgi:hypothetical protein
MPTIHEQQLQKIQERMGELEESFKPHHQAQVDIAVEMQQLTEEAWGCKLANMFPSMSFAEVNLLATIKVTDNLNKSDDLGKALYESQSKVTHIEHDNIRQEYRIYGVPAHHAKDAIAAARGSEPASVA